jgi:hypothetical protein
LFDLASTNRLIDANAKSPPSNSPMIAQGHAMS